MSKKLKFRIGDVVVVKKILVKNKITDLKYHYIKKITYGYKDLESNQFNAVVTGYGTKQEGESELLGEEGYIFKSKKTIKCWFVRRYIRGKEISVPEDGIEIVQPFMYYGSEYLGQNRLQPIKLQAAHKNSEKDILELKEYAKNAKRDSKGRWIKEEVE